MNIRPAKNELKEGGLLLIDKPYEWTSFNAISKIRRQINAKIGHAGTLDPLATGLLICCTGKMTKRIVEFQRLPKEYTGSFTLGAVTPTYDLESEPEQFKPFEHLTAEDLQRASQVFLGDILQVPPIHSAIKKDGKRAYELARKGVEIQLAPRPIQISYFEITNFEKNIVEFRIGCSTGTYIRSIAQDFGQELGCGAYLSSLRRTRIGDFSVEQALTPQEWIDFWEQQETS